MPSAGHLVNLQSSSQIDETEAICLKFSPNFLHSLFTPLFSLKCAPSPSPMLSHVYFGALIEMTAIPKSTLGRGKSHKCFKISDEYCRQKYHISNPSMQKCHLRPWSAYKICCLQDNPPTENWKGQLKTGCLLDHCALQDYGRSW